MIDEFLSMPQDCPVVNLCQPWPVPSTAQPPGPPVPPGTVFLAVAVAVAVAVLVLSGVLDSLTASAQGAQAAALFPAAHQVVVCNSFQVTAVGDLDHCASDIVRRFFGTRSAGGTSGADTVPANRLVRARAGSCCLLRGPHRHSGRRRPASKARPMTYVPLRWH